MAETFVFVHGAWLGAWCWDKVIPFLEEKGHKAIALDLPGHGKNEAPIEEQDIHTYSAYIAEVLRKQEEKVILVAHSMGGMSASEAAAAVPEKVKKLVYVTAFLPKDGQANNYYGDISGIQETNWYELGSMNIGVVLTDDKKAMYLEPGFAMPALYNDIPEAEGLEYCKLHGGESLAAPYTAAKLNDAFDEIPKYYIRCSQDGILTPDIQEKMLNATPVEKIYTLDSGHSPYISKPQELADILLDVADR